MITALDLARRVEETELNARPAPRQLLLGDWLLRFAAGCTRGANSVTPLRDAAGEVADARIGQCIALYAAQHLPCLFRLPSHLAHRLDAALDSRGFAPPEDETSTRFQWLARVAPGDMADVRLTPQPDAAWLAAQTRLRGEADAGPRAAILAALAIPAAFATASLPSGEVSLAYAALHDGIAAISMVITDPGARRRGLARQVLLALLAWARDAGAEGACLQVAADNAAAIGLYESLGFRTELYRYHYRRLALA